MATRTTSTSFALAMAVAVAVAAQAAPAKSASAYNTAESLRLAIQDLINTCGWQYPKGKQYLDRLAAIEKAGAAAGEDLERLRSEALLDNPLMRFERLLMVRRKGKGRNDLGMPVNHVCNSGLKRTGWDNEIAVLSPPHPAGKLTTVHRPADGGYVGEVDLHWDAGRVLFTQSDKTNWKIRELSLASSASFRTVSKMDDDVDAFDACYVPDANGADRVVFASTASFHAVPCWHGKQRACTLYTMDADGAGVRQLCYDQDLDLHPSVLNDGQIIYSRWEYAGPLHMYLRPLMAMNPDGSNQRAVYGSNSYWPNALFFPRAVPGSASKIIAVVSGYHGQPRMGVLALIDLARGTRSAEGVVQLIPGRGKPIATPVRDVLLDDVWPKFLHPWPLSDRHFLVAGQLVPNGTWAIYLADVFDNLVTVYESAGEAMLEPIPLIQRERPPLMPDRVNPARKDAVVYVGDVYAGEATVGVPRGAIERMRIVSYSYGYPNLAGPDKIGSGAPWEAMQILGTVPVAQDGSAVFRVPANTPISLQLLDANGRAVQLMRSWYTAMPGEQVSCVGCHERPADTAALSSPRLARAPDEIAPWYGPRRGLSFSRDVQPVLDRHCARCHDGTAGRPDLRSQQPGYAGTQLGGLSASRLHPSHHKAAGDRILYTPAYEALLRHIRRVGIEDDVNLLLPGEYHADTSPLIRMLTIGHRGVRLEAEAWDRLVTWIDLNGPCHGTWREVYGMDVPDGMHQRRMALRKQYGGPEEDMEAIPKLPPAFDTLPMSAAAPSRPPKSFDSSWAFDANDARRRQAALGSTSKAIDLGSGVTITLQRIPAGRFRVGDPCDQAGDVPREVRIDKPFWLAATEITNEQYCLFDPNHDSGTYIKRPLNGDGHGSPLCGARQPAVRVSWERATAFCDWVSRRSELRCSLPTEEQWEWACRAGTASAMNYGDANADFSRHANFHDASMARPAIETGALNVSPPRQRSDGVAASAPNDGAVVTANVGRYLPNAWGLLDMHGNAAEWTCSIWPPSPSLRVVRGGSFFDQPRWGASSVRWRYPQWQRVFNVGFRVACGPK